MKKAVLPETKGFTFRCFPAVIPSHEGLVVTCVHRKEEDADVEFEPVSVGPGLSWTSWKQEAGPVKARRGRLLECGGSEPNLQIKTFRSCLRLQKSLFKHSEHVLLSGREHWYWLDGNPHTNGNLSGRSKGRRWGVGVGQSQGVGGCQSSSQGRAGEKESEAWIWSSFTEKWMFWWESCRCIHTRPA